MITDYLERTLKAYDLELNEFSELINRLLNYGILSRQQNQKEQTLYDRYLRISGLVDNYLSVMDIAVFHDEKFEYLRLYPPGSIVPGLEEQESYTGGLRIKLKQSEIVLVLILRIQYDKAIREGRVGIDEQGYVTEKLESITIAMKEILNRQLPKNLVERHELFSKLRQLRLIDYNKETIDQVQEALIKISPIITSFVNDDALAALDNSQTTEETKETNETKETKETEEDKHVT